MRSDVGFENFAILEDYRASTSPFNTASTIPSGIFRLFAAMRGVMPDEIAAWMSERWPGVGVTFLAGARFLRGIEGGR